MPQDFVTRAIVRTARRLPGFPALSVLDLSCGRGEILSQLARDGCTVRGTHYREDDYKLSGQAAPLLTPGLPIDSGVDLHAPLPYPDAAYDVVILSEVVEHLFSFIPVVREAGRVLKPGGFLILSTPNLARLHSRWHYFWTGAHKLIRRRVGWDISADDFYAYHVNPLDFPVFHTVLFQTGMEVRSLTFTRFKPGHAWLLLLYPLVWLTTKLETSRHRSGEQHARGERDLFRWMVHPAMLASEQLLVVAQKKKQDSWEPVRVNDESENSEGAGLQESRARSPEA